MNWASLFVPFRIVLTVLVPKIVIVVVTVVELSLFFLKPFILAFDAWAANPWVAAITFRVVKANIDAVGVGA